MTAAPVLECSGETGRTALGEGASFVYRSAQTVACASPWLACGGFHPGRRTQAVACAALETLTDRRRAPRYRPWPGACAKSRSGPRGCSVCAPGRWQGKTPCGSTPPTIPAGPHTLATAIREARPDGGDRVALVIAMQAVKDLDGVLAELVPMVDEVIACPLPDSGGQEGGPGGDPRDVAAVAEALGGQGPQWPAA